MITHKEFYNITGLTDVLDVILNNTPVFQTKSGSNYYLGKHEDLYVYKISNANTLYTSLGQDSNSVRWRGSSKFDSSKPSPVQIFFKENSTECLVNIGAQDELANHYFSSCEPFAMYFSATDLNTLNNSTPNTKNFIALFDFHGENLLDQHAIQIFSEENGEIERHQITLINPLLNINPIETDIIYPVIIPNSTYIADNLFYFSNIQKLPAGTIVSDGPNLYKVLISGDKLENLIWKIHTYEG